MFSTAFVTIHGRVTAVYMARTVHGRVRAMYTYIPVHVHVYACTRQLHGRERAAYGPSRPCTAVHTARVHGSVWAIALGRVHGALTAVQRYTRPVYTYTRVPRPLHGSVRAVYTARYVTRLTAVFGRVHGMYTTV